LKEDSTQDRLVFIFSEDLLDGELSALGLFLLPLLVELVGEIDGDLVQESQKLIHTLPICT
jgi:hypothetical protein